MTSAPAMAASDNVSTLRRYGALARRTGVDRLYLLLTFDCDTDGDILASHDLNRDLQRRGIKAGFAVPGAQLQKAPESWRALAQQDVEFLNHGGRAHAEFRDGRYWPATFYSKMNADEVVSDVRLGHQLVADLAGVTPVGFRAPHFGSFHAPEQLQLLYDTVKPLGYAYCSGTLPAMGLARGPFVDMGGITEVPTSGSFRNPTTLLDTWTYLTDRTHYSLGDEYSELFIETIEQMTQLGIPGVMTIYGDPSHVMGQRPFERALDAIGKYQVPSLLGRDAVRQFRAI
jgi:hypothetical protein